jgi:methyltransferase-like protein/SAM-dependent methyltransferase
MEENQILNEAATGTTVIYPGFVIPQAHPERLAATAKLYGMNPASAGQCRVLELGCGTGTNLNWLASYLPESEFVGIDLAEAHIHQAQKGATELELRNVSFSQTDILAVTEETFGKFDYIIAHGVFSWVPEPVRQKILELYSELLNPEGVGFISYNVYPGFYRRQIVRDIMLYFGQRFADPMEKVQQGVALIDFLTAQTVDSPIYHELLKYELEGFSRRSAENLYHDDLFEFNQPFYFTEFIAEAEKFNLKFLSESDYLPTQRRNKPEVAEAFQNISRDPIEFEQYLDFLECRRFRQTLLCKKAVTLETEISPHRVKEFYLSSLLRPTSPVIDLNPDSFKEFTSRKGDQIKISHVLSKVLLSNMVERGAHPVKFNELIEEANELLKSQGFVCEDLQKEAEITASLLLQLFSPHAIRFHTIKADALDYVSEKPEVSKFAVWQSSQNDVAANFYDPELPVPDDFTRLILRSLDGTRSLEQLTSELTKIIESNEEIPDKEEFLRQLPERLNRDLFVLAKMGYLIG